MGHTRGKKDDSRCRLCASRRGKFGRSRIQKGLLRSAAQIPQMMRPAHGSRPTMEPVPNRAAMAPNWRQSGAVLTPPCPATLSGANLTSDWRHSGAAARAVFPLAPNWRQFGAVLAPRAGDLETFLPGSPFLHLPPIFRLRS